MFLKAALCFAIWLLLSCYGTSPIDEEYAGKIVRNSLALSDNVSAQKLTGGLGGTTNFLVTNNSNKYVTRFITNKSQQGPEIYNFKIASGKGSGPQIYFYNSNGIIIMEYLSGKAISMQDIIEYLADKAPPSNPLQSDQFYVKLAYLLQKIHLGRAFYTHKKDVLNGLAGIANAYNQRYKNFDLISKIHLAAGAIREILLPHFTTNTPCHNDFHRGNFILMESEIKAIDYGDAGQGDPYFDIATSTVSLYTKPIHENILFTTYLGRQPSETEQAKLFLMKQISLIHAFFHHLAALSPEDIPLYESAKAMTFTNLAKEALESNDYFDKPETKLKLVKAYTNQIFNNFESQEFRIAVNELIKNKPNQQPLPAKTKIKKKGLR